MAPRKLKYDIPSAQPADKPVDLDAIFQSAQDALEEDRQFLEGEGGEFDVDAGEYIEEEPGDDKHLG